MDFDTSMIMDYIIPDSPSDFGAILLWILSILLLIIVISDIRLYWNNRKTFKKIEKPQETFNVKVQIKNSKEERIQKFVEVENKVDRIIAEKYNL